MSFLANEALQTRFVKALNANADFRTQTQLFDGSVLLEVDQDRLWLKIYRGKVIDHETFGKRRWADLTYPGKRDFSDDPELKRVGEMEVAIRTEGNLLESGRLTEAMFQLAYTLQAAAKQR